MRLTPRIEVEFADTAVGLAAAGLGDTYIPRVLVRSLDPRLHATSFDPPLVDVFALVSRPDRACLLLSGTSSTDS